MTRLQGRLAGYVLFVKPDGMEDDWERTDLWSSAALIDGVTVVGDPGGIEAAHFGAQTSGQVYLYAPDGELLFQGGITPTRSHQGDSVGRHRIIDFVTRRGADRRESDVYGCALSADAEDFWLAGLRSVRPSSM
jgi:hypothetical protein